VGKTLLWMVDIVSEDMKVHNFAISNQKLKIDQMSYDTFSIKSAYKDYSVVFDQSVQWQTINQYCDKNDVLLIDRNVFNLYSDRIKHDKDRTCIIDAAEDSKTIRGVLDVVDFLNRLGITKGEKLVVAGGGITQDIGAFVAASYKRGINWVLLPTTLLSMCDSCIGGKTGINYNNVKNQLALFASPTHVVINTNFIKTLHIRDINSGMGEILKLCLLGGQYFVDLYNDLVIDGEVKFFKNYKDLIVNSLYIKKAIVEEDEFEFDIRKSLNYGHTVGHAIETLTNYEIPHGQAVAIGMQIVNYLSGYGDLIVKKNIDDLIKNKDVLKSINFSSLADLVKKDKKTIGNNATFVLLQDPGNTFFKSIAIDDILIKEIKDALNETIS